jgi:pyruvate/2-oxoglutarate dehydrogenase complex dihydrolipoamide acyltransferase (E2) component
MTNERLLAYALIALGGVTLLAQLGGADWLWLGLISAAFLLGYSARQNYGFLVAGSVLMGVAVGTLIGTQSGMLLSLAVAFFAIDRVEPKANRWPLYAAGIFAVLGGLSALSALGLLGSVGFALLLIALGAFLLLRKQPQTPSTPQETYRDTPPTQTTPVQTPSAQTAPAQAAPPADTAPSTPSAVSAATDNGSTLAGTPLTAAVREQSAPAAEPVTPDTDLKAAAAEAAGAGDEAVAARRHRLELWRRETASCDGTPAYIVFSNDTLTKIAEANPRTLEELGRVRGVGPVKLERYGPAVLELLDNP